MATQTVVADTNFYRGISDHELSELVTLERARGVKPRASFLACSELLSHLLDTEATAYNSYRASVRRLFLHCSRGDDHGSFPIVADPHGIIAHSLFDVRRPERQRLAAAFGRIVRRAAFAPLGDHLADLALDLQRVKRHGDEMESAFVKMLQEVRRALGCDPDAPSDWEASQRPSAEQYLGWGLGRSALAAGLVVAVAGQCGRVLEGDEVVQLAKILEPDLATASLVFEVPLRKVLLHGADPAKQGNYVWDVYFAVTAASNMLEDGAPVLLVTGDGAILRAAKTNGAEARILSPSGYRQYLEAPQND